MMLAVGQEPNLVEMLTARVKEVAKIPVMVKLTPNITDIRQPAYAAKQGGADALAMINTVKSIAEVDTDNFVPFPQVGLHSTTVGLSGKMIKPIALNMVKNCAKEVGLPISGIRGIENRNDAVKFFLLGVALVQICTGVMKRGFGLIHQLTSGLMSYMSDKGFEKISDFSGKALANITEWETLDLSYKVVAHINSGSCIGCRQCFVVCNDGGYQAIQLKEIDGQIIPVITEENCTGCNLCSLVCPVEKCITMIRKN